MGESSPDKVEASRHCQTGRARRARREGIREKPVSESSLCGTDSNLADMGRVVVRVIRSGKGWRPFGSPSGAVGQPAKKVCGVLAGATGVKPGASLVDRKEVNTGTSPGPPSPRAEPGSWRVGALPTDRPGLGRSRRSTPRTGKPATWGRAAASRATKGLSCRKRHR